MIFYQSQKVIPFSEFDHFILATICVFISCKIQNHQLKYELFQKFYFDHKVTFLLKEQENISKTQTDTVVDSGRKLTAKEKIEARKALKKQKDL